LHARTSDAKHPRKLGSRRTVVVYCANVKQLKGTELPGYSRKGAKEYTEFRNVF
jgi:hypothetical protein